MHTVSSINKILNTVQRVDDGELAVEGIIRSIYQDKVLVEVDADEAPLEFSMTAVKAAALGFDLEEFPEDKRYITYSINETLQLTPVEYESKAA